MSIAVSFSADGWADYLYWQTQDKRTLNKINNLIQDIQRNGVNGMGKTERLKGKLSELWSKRIDEKNRLLFRIVGDNVEIASCRDHYDDH